MQLFGESNQKQRSGMVRTLTSGRANCFAFASTPFVSGRSLAIDTANFGLLLWRQTDLQVPQITFLVKELSC